jgi:ferrous iron transport protein B
MSELTDREEITIGFVGNPNCGKTTLFNAYTGANLKVANWPGVTVEKKEGALCFHDHLYHLVDLPGTYSLTSYTMEEKVARQYLLSDEVDVIIDVADASSLERNLYLTLQLLEFGKPVVLALNMMDIVAHRGMEIDLHRFPEMLGIPVIPISARKKRGLDILMHAVAHHHHLHQDGKTPLIHNHPDITRHHHQHHRDFAMVYNDDIEDRIDRIIEELKQRYTDVRNHRWVAIKLLEQDSEIMEKYPIELPEVLNRSYEQDIIKQKYDFIDEIMDEVVVHRATRAESTNSIDRILTDNWLGLPAFALIMAVVFFFTFTMGDWIKSYFEFALDIAGEAITLGLTAIGAGDMIISLVVDGIIAGVGAILMFLPNIFVLFMALAFLEDSGYISRVAYVMDGIMSYIGLSGRAFIPMILGFGCSVPAIMASRVLENERDRRKTILVTPFMSCSARLPIYVIFSELFFEQHAMLAAYSMYIIGLLVAVFVAWVLHFFDKGPAGNTLLIELPDYKRPSIHTIYIYVSEKVKDYISKAGTTIFVASVVMWFLLNFGLEGYTKEMTQSFGALIGQCITPIFVPIGLGYWQIVTAIFAGISAKEVVVSSCAVLFGIANINSAAGIDTMAGLLASMGFGPLNAYAMMVFCLLYVPCMATLATIKKETGSWYWTGLTVVFQFGMAWGVTFMVYQLGKRILY